MASPDVGVAPSTLPATCPIPSHSSVTSPLSPSMIVNRAWVIVSAIQIAVLSRWCLSSRHQNARVHAAHLVCSDSGPQVIVDLPPARAINMIIWSWASEPSR